MVAAREGSSIPDTGALSVRDCDQYFVHLCAVSMQEQLVLASADVHNQFGVLLLRKGTPLGSHALQRLSGHRLNRPVDELFTVRFAPEPEALAREILSAALAEPDLAAITRSQPIADRLAVLCATSGIPRPLLQKLTVLRRVLPRVHHRALFTAWLATALATNRTLPDAEATLLLAAALLHDVGFLHLPPELSDRRGDMAPEDWTTLRRHPLRSAELIAQSWPEAPDRLIRIVTEHHERHDGAGYPEGSPGGEQDPLSGIIGLADMLHALRFDATDERVDNLAACLPFLRVNRRTWGIANYRPLARLLLDARTADAGWDATALPSPQGLIDANRSLGTLLGLLPSARRALGALGENRTARSLLQIFEELDTTASAAGLGAETLTATLQQSLREGRTDPGLGDVALTIRESLWLVRRIDRQLRELLQQRAGTEEASQLRDLSLAVRFELTRAWRRFEHPQ